jgi:hypothetical protein
MDQLHAWNSCLTSCLLCPPLPPPPPPGEKEGERQVAGKRRKFASVTDTRSERTSMTSMADKFLRERSDDIIDVKKAIGKFEVGGSAACVCCTCCCRLPAQASTPTYAAVGQLQNTTLACFAAPRYPGMCMTGWHDGGTMLAMCSHAHPPHLAALLATCLMLNA